MSFLQKFTDPFRLKKSYETSVKPTWGNAHVSFLYAMTYELPSLILHLISNFLIQLNYLR